MSSETFRASGKQIDNGNGDDEMAFLAALKRFAPAVCAFWMGQQTNPDLVVHSVTVSARQSGWLAVGRATDVPHVRAVVAFGGGASVYDALKALDMSMRLGAWRQDRFG